MIVQASTYSLTMEQKWLYGSVRPEDVPANAQSAAQAPAQNLAEVLASGEAQAASGLSRGLDAGTDVMRGLSGTFAEEMTRRLSEYTDENGEKKDPAELVASLTGAVDTIRDTCGEGAASAAMGILLKSVQHSPLTEDSLRRGMVKALNFIDNNVGVESGDTAMEAFNGVLNDQVNDFFDNGKEERFAVVLSNGKDKATFGSSRDAAAALSQYAQDTLPPDEAAALPSADGDLTAFFKDFPRKTLGDFLKSLNEKKKAQEEQAAENADLAAADETGEAQTSEAAASETASEAAAAEAASQVLITESLTLTIRIERLTVFTDSGEASGQPGDGSAPAESGQAQPGGQGRMQPYGLFASALAQALPGLALNIPV